MAKLAKDDSGQSIQALRPGETEVLSPSGSAVSGTAVPDGVNAIRIVADVAINYYLNGTATSAQVFLPAGAVEVIRVLEGDVISVIGNGNVYLTEME
jgi:hypothetical protein